MGLLTLVCNDTVAQAVKHLTFAPGVMGASPSGATLTVSPPN